MQNPKRTSDMNIRPLDRILREFETMLLSCSARPGEWPIIDVIPAAICFVVIAELTSAAWCLAHSTATACRLPQRDAGIRDGTPYWYSQMLAVAPDYRNPVSAPI